MNDLISRQEVINAILHYMIRIPDYMSEWGRKLTAAIKEDLMDDIEAIPPAQPTLYGYNIEHLEMIARVLQKEDLQPERVVEILNDIGVELLR